MHGYDHPWPSGGGKNLLQITARSGTNNGVYYTVNKDNGGNIISVVANGTPSGTNNSIFLLGTIPAGTYILSGSIDGSASTYYLLTAGGEAYSYNGDSNQFTISTEKEVYIRVVNGFTATNVVFQPMIRLATETDATFAPYSNECPISGWTEAEIYHEAEYDADADPAITVTFPETIYGGDIEVISGKLKSTMGIVDLGTLNWQNRGNEAENTFSVTPFPNYKLSNVVKAICSNYPYYGTVSSIADMKSAPDKCFCLYYLNTSTGTGLYIKDSAYADVATFKAAMSGVQLCYELDEAVEYDLTENELIALDGPNVIWANTGDITVTYIAKSAKFSFGSPLRIYNYNNLKLFGNTYIEHGKG